jgi:probable HAF family extracellular repeat protein
MSSRTPLRSARVAFTPIVAAILVAFLLGRSESAVTYTAINLGTVEQGSTAVVRGPNAAGTAVGAGRIAGMRRGLLFARGGLREIAGLGDYTTVFGINDGDDVVGGSNTATAIRAFRQTAAGQMRELPPLAGDTASTAFAVNRSRQAVGFSSGPGGERAVLWAANGTVSALPVAPAVQTSRALGINESGDVVGAWDTGAGRRAILWPGGGSGQDLGTPAGHITGEAIAVNARLDVVGYSADLSGARRATLWPAGGSSVDLGTLPGGDFSQALGINDAGDIVGTSTSNFGSRAFIWTATSGLQDLNDLVVPAGFVLTRAVGINAAGMVVAIGRDASDDPHVGHEAHDHPVRVFLLLPAGVRP